MLTASAMQPCSMPTTTSPLMALTTGCSSTTKLCICQKCCGRTEVAYHKNTNSVYLELLCSLVFVSLQGLLSCFLMERLHRRAKRFMLGRLNVQSYERGIMSDIVLRHLHDLQGTWGKSSIGKTSKAKDDVSEIVRRAFPSAHIINEVMQTS